MPRHGYNFSHLHTLKPTRIPDRSVNKTFMYPFVTLIRLQHRNTAHADSASVAVQLVILHY